jgi:hypothetical protein
VNQIRLFEIIQQHVQLYYSMLRNTMIENYHFKFIHLSVNYAQCEQFDQNIV